MTLLSRGRLLGNLMTVVCLAAKLLDEGDARGARKALRLGQKLIQVDKRMEKVAEQAYAATVRHRLEKKS